MLDSHSPMVCPGSAMSIATAPVVSVVYTSPRSGDSPRSQLPPRYAVFREWHVKLKKVFLETLCLVFLEPPGKLVGCVYDRRDGVRDIGYIRKTYQQPT